MSDEERSLVHTSEFLVGDSAGTNLDRVTDVAARISEALGSHPEIFDGLGDDDEVDLFELGYRCFGDDPVLVSDPAAVVAVLQTFFGDVRNGEMPLDREWVDQTLKTIVFAMDRRLAVDPPPAPSED